uniref:Toxin candidate TRINITY_DN31025_c0_g2_i1 n=1 Tax=Pachycerianthus maua TaxID=2736681 RepID=A0A7G7WYZ1_9CNID|nr:toxin candidate TRINITY_DN31025_c0_g2_i1 [Pachycerianthus maua]
MLMLYKVLHLITLLSVLYPKGNCQRDGFLRDCLDAHNKLREKHGVPPLEWDDKLEEQATIMAENLADESMLIDHDGFNDTLFGENIGYFKGYYGKCMGEKEPGCTQCREIVKNWYDEGKKLYDFDNPENSPLDLKIFHFAQIVWKKSKKLGFGTSVDADGALVSVARYRPAGNIGSYKDNVFPQRKDEV